jgi:hypothetical protein
MATCRKTAAAEIAATMERMPLYIFFDYKCRAIIKETKRKHKVHVKVGDNDVSNHDNPLPSPCFPWLKIKKGE